MLLDYTKSNRSESEKYRQNILNILSNLKSFKPFNYSHYFNTYKAAPLTKSKLFVEKNSDNTIYMEKSYKIIKSGNIIIPELFVAGRSCKIIIKMIFVL